MSTITRELAKLFRKITNSEIDAEGNAHVVLSPADSLLINNARIALASLEAEPVCVIDQSNLDYLKSGSDADVWPASRKEMGDVLLYRTAPPAPVALPSGYSDFEEIWSSSTHPLTQDDEMKDFAWDIWNACRAAMLQGADGALTNEDTKKMDELVMWIKRLAHSLRKASPDSKLQSDAMDYLSRKGLIGVKDILR